MSVKTKFRFLFIVIIFAALFFTTCDSPMGMGKPVDLEPASFIITGILLPDGTETQIFEEDNKTFVGPGILVGPGFYLKGKAWDNESVVGITVEETGAGAEIVDGRPRMWSNANIGPKKQVPGVMKNEFDWSISLDGISSGERNILITVYDLPGNIGPNSVKQLTLLVDIVPPFIDKINIERKAGITVNLLPRTVLENMDSSSFENIDYFQNENFSIRASVKHNFSITGVVLNLLGEDGKPLFASGLERVSGTTVYAPTWNITADQLTAANPKYASGRHYLKVSITARAEAGHTGQNEDKTNILYNLCWYPEADIPKMQMTVPPEKNNDYRFEKGNKIPVRVFDDDNVRYVYASLVTKAVWDGYMPSYSEDEKLQALKNNLTNASFPGLSNNRLAAASRNVVIDIDAGENRGDYRLVVLAQDIKDSLATGVWGWKLFNINIVEEGIPIISIDSPTANSTPALTGGSKFTLSGNVQNLDDLDIIRIAWVPAGAAADTPNWDANTEGQKALKSGNKGVIANGIKIWELNLPPGTAVSSKYTKQTFSLTFDIFTDFMFKNKVENESKYFLFYVVGKGGDEVFENFSVLPYSKPPVLTITPVSYAEYAPNSQIPFSITAVSPDGIQIDTNKVTLVSKSDNNSSISLTRSGNVWTGTASGKSAKGTYDYIITAEDKLGFITQQTVTISVTAAPVLQSVTSPHNSGVVFSSRDTITIQLVFDSPVSTVTGTPRLTLGGFTPSSTVRYANYSGGAGTTTLNFSYAVQGNDYTGVPGPTTGLTVTAFGLNGGTVSADIDTSKISALAAANKLPSTKRLNVDGRAPTITGIAISGTASNNWNREGEDITVRVNLSREIRVMGTPKLRMQFNGTGTVSERDADFQTTENDNTTMVFQYRVKANDFAEPVKIFTPCFSAADSQIITDTAGANGNYLSTTTVPAATGTVNVDAVAPVALNVTYTANGNNPASKTIQIATGNIEANATVEYTVNGLSWTTITSPYTIGPLTAVNNYSVRARQTDRAGNVSPDGTKLDFTISDCSLIAVTCDNPNGAYPAGSTLTFKLIFSGKVFNTNASGTSITLSGTINGNAGTHVITFPAVTQANAATTLSASWTNIQEGVIMNPVTITDIDLSAVRGNDSNAVPDKPSNVITDYNSSRTGLKVLSVRPTITAINTKAITANDIVLDSANTTVTLTFSQPVWPEKGVITVKPASGWLIPPVLSNEDFAKINNAVSSTNQTALTDSTKTSYYIKTTHGLKSGATYVPDIDTKYVLNFSSGLDNAVLRPILESAKYLWQEIESVSTTQVTSSADNKTITLKLDALPNGRQWKIEIAEGAFRDEAGNTFAGWGPPPATAYTFWSAKTANPVIRVNRVSNNSATTAPSTNTVTGTVGNANEVTSRINVQYRIDCETPGATISYGTLNASVSTVSTATTGAQYGASSTDGTQNSTNADATAAQLGGITATTAYPTNITTNYLTIGDTDLYTARKDYIAATAVRSGTPALATSDRSYEGAFKTVIVYRTPPAGDGTLGTNRFVKLEATNTQNGAVTISGFPMNYNDTSGKGSKYAYRNTAATDDWIWISWEIVSNFWHVGMIVNSSTPNSALPADPWAPFNNDWYAHNFRKYGNWGLRIGN